MSESAKQNFLKLYQAHQVMVRSILYHMIDRNHLDDLVQETFIKIWKTLPLFSFRSSEKTWIYRIVINTAIDFLRKEKGKNVIKLAEYQDHAFAEDNSHAEQQKQVQMALQQLEESQRAVLILHYFEDLDLAEVGTVLDIPVGTVKSRLFNARQTLKGILLEQGKDYDVLQRR